MTNNNTQVFVLKLLLVLGLALSSTCLAASPEDFLYSLAISPRHPEAEYISQFPREVLTRYVNDYRNALAYWERYHVHDWTLVKPTWQEPWIVPPPPWDCQR